LLKTTLNYIPWIAASHDVGKVSPGFQLKYFSDKLPESFHQESKDSYELNHSIISAAEGGNYFNQNDLGGIVSWILGAHHGKPVKAENPECSIYGGSYWHHERIELLKLLEKRFAPDVDLNSCSINFESLKYLIAGLVSVSDWIGSDEQYFSPDGYSIEHTEIDEMVRNAVRGCGWNRPDVKKGLSFKEVFNREPYPIQQAFIDSIDGPGLYIFEAPMGIGKTEAALYASYKLLQEGHNTGIYFALPTQLTSNKIHVRVEQFLSKVINNFQIVKLIHGSSWITQGTGEE